MTRRISTSISDGVLAVASLYSAYKVLEFSFFGTVALGIVGVAAFLGSLRFAYEEPSRTLVSWHSYLAWLAIVLGPSCMTVAFVRQVGMPGFIGYVLLVGALAVVVIHGGYNDDAHHIATEMIAFTSIAFTLFCSFIGLNPYAMVGSVLYYVSGTVVTPTGEWAGVPRKDIFHCLLTVGNIAFMMGLSRKFESLSHTPPKAWQITDDKIPFYGHCRFCTWRCTRILPLQFTSGFFF